MNFDPQEYRRWFETPLGRTVDADEKHAVFTSACLHPGERVLDIGCGEGNFTAPEACVTGCAVGLDRSALMLSAGRNRLARLPGIQFVRGDAATLPFRAGTFDIALAVTLLCFNSDAERIIREAHRVLRPGGRLVLGELGKWSPWAAFRRLRAFVTSSPWRNARFFSPGDLRRLVEHGGFVSVRARSAVFYPPLRHPWLLQIFRPIEWVGKRTTPHIGAFVVVVGSRPG